MDNLEENEPEDDFEDDMDSEEEWKYLVIY